MQPRKHSAEGTNIWEPNILSAAGKRKRKQSLLGNEWEHKLNRIRMDCENASQRAWTKFSQ